MGETQALSVQQLTCNECRKQVSTNFPQQTPISLCISLFEDTDLWQPAECWQSMQSQHGGTDGRFVPSHEEADHGRGEGFLRQPRTCSALRWSCTCPVPTVHWNNLLSLGTLLPRLPASARGPFKTLLPVFLVHFLSIPALRAVSPQIQFPKEAWTFFCLNHVAWPRPGPITALLLGRALPNPPAKARASSSFRNRAAHLELSSHCWPGRSAWSSPLSGSQPVAKG